MGVEIWASPRSLTTSTPLLLTARRRRWSSVNLSRFLPWTFGGVFAQDAVSRVDLEFKTLPPRLGRKRARHMFLGATVHAAGLLGSQEAGFTFCELLGLESQRTAVPYWFGIVGRREAKGRLVLVAA